MAEASALNIPNDQTPTPFMDTLTSLAVIAATSFNATARAPALGSGASKKRGQVIAAGPPLAEDVLHRRLYYV